MFAARGGGDGGYGGGVGDFWGWDWVGVGVTGEVGEEVWGGDRGD